MNVLDQLISLTNLLEKNNTHTSSYDISDGLVERVQRIVYGKDGIHEALPMAEVYQPIIFVELGNKIETFSQIGNSVSRYIDINYNIVVYTNYGMSSDYYGDSSVNSDKENLTLTQNIENLLRHHVSLSNTVDQSLIEGTDFSTDIQEESYISVSTINLMTKKLSS